MIYEKYNPASTQLRVPTHQSAGSPPPWRETAQATPHSPVPVICKQI